MYLNYHIMKKIIKKTLFALAIISFMISIVSCEKEEVTISTHSDDEECRMYAANEYIPYGQQWNLSVLSPNAISKGYYINLSDLGKEYQFDSCTYKKDKSVRYKVMKINRRNSDKYFYIMLENLSVKLDTGCCAYQYSEANAAKYGRLYSWYAANALAQDFTMKLPIYKVDGTVIQGLTVKGRLPNKEDIYDLLEVDSLGYNYDNGFSIDDCYDQGVADVSKYMYYDMFLFGIEDADADDSKAFHCLGGSYSDPHNCSQTFNGLNQRGSFWTSVSYLNSKSGHQPLRIDYKNNSGNTFNFVASALFSVNATIYDNERLSVRYVFEPKYLTK